MEYVDKYWADGYAILRGVFSREEIREISAAFDRMVQWAMDKGGSFRHQNIVTWMAKDAKVGPFIRGMQWPSHVEAELDQIRTDPRILAIVEPLIGNNLKQIINQMHWKKPGGAVAWEYHQDVRSRKPDSAFRQLARSYVQTGLAVDAHKRENGCMRIYPGSHKAEKDFELHNIGDAHGKRQVSEYLVKTIGLDPAGFVDVLLEAGDIALWHPFVIHGSGPNLTAGDRRFYINGYVIAENCDRGPLVFKNGKALPLGEPVLIQYEELFSRPEPHLVDGPIKVRD